MTDTVAIISTSESFRRIARCYLEVQGLRVLELERLPERLPRAHVIFLDVGLLERGLVTRTAIKARAIGSDIVLCGHWSVGERLEEWARAARLSFFEYPMHPKALLRYFVVNRFNVKAVHDAEVRCLAGIAGRLYDMEGVAVPGLDELSLIVRNRMIEVLAGSLALYDDFLSEEREEVGTLADYFRGEGDALFQPFLLYSIFQDELLARLEPAARFLSCAYDSGLEALALAMLAEAQGLDCQITALDSRAVSLADRALDAKHLDHTPQEFRKLCQRSLELGEDGCLRPTAGLLERITALESPAELSAQGPYQVICFQHLMDERAPNTSPKVKDVALQLAPDGFLLLGPNETILARDFPLVAEKYGILTIYQHESREGKTP